MRIKILATIYFVLAAQFVQASISCPGAHRASATAKADLKTSSKTETKLEELGRLLDLDAQTVAHLQDPMLLTYTYLRILDRDLSSDQVNYYLTQIRENMNADQINLFETVQTKILNKLKDPEIRAQVEAFAKGTESVSEKIAQRTRIQQTFKQIMSFPKTVKRMKELAKLHYSTSVMDRGLFDFLGSVKYGLKESSLRRWDDVEGSFGAIRLTDLTNISPEFWARGALFSSEVEGGIRGYSEQSGEMFRGFMPSLAFFMGRNNEEAAKIDAKSENFCSHVWCREEKRHEGTLRTMYRQLFGIQPPEKNPSVAYHELELFKTDDVLYHLFSRNATEWNANSGYLFMMAHSKGASHQHVNNIRADETKHISIFSSAFKYVYGQQIGFRFKMMLKKIYNEFQYEKSNRSADGNILNDAGFNMVEIAMSHIFVESNVRKYMSTVPLRTLQKIFEAKPSVEEDLSDVNPEKREKILAMRVREKEAREKLSRWKPKDREKAFALTRFEKDNALLISDLVTRELNSFKGAEVAGSAADLAARSQIAAVKPSTGVDPLQLQASLTEILRDYQILSSTFLTSKGYTIVFKNAWEGFQIVEPQAAPVSKKIFETTEKLRVRVGSASQE